MTLTLIPAVVQKSVFTCMICGVRKEQLSKFISGIIHMIMIENPLDLFMFTLPRIGYLLQQLWNNFGNGNFMRISNKITNKDFLFLISQSFSLVYLLQLCH